MRWFRRSVMAVLATAALATGGGMVPAASAMDAGGAPYVVGSRCKEWLGGGRCDTYWSNGDHTWYTW